MALSHLSRHCVSQVPEELLYNQWRTLAFCLETSLVIWKHLQLIPGPIRPLPEAAAVHGAAHRVPVNPSKRALPLSTQRVLA